MAHAHLGFHSLEVIRQVGLDLAAHPFSSPLLEPANSLVHMHGGIASLTSGVVVEYGE